jgi:hypothetical protein
MWKLFGFLALLGAVLAPQMALAWEPSHIEDVTGHIEVEWSPQPEHLLEPGGWVKYTLAVENISPLTVTLEVLADSVYGPLAQWPDGNCSIPQTLSPAGTYTCAINVEVIGDPGTYEDVVTVEGTYWLKIPVYGTATAEVMISAVPPPAGRGMPAAVVTGGMAASGLGLLLAGALVRRRMA